MAAFISAVLVSVPARAQKKVEQPRLQASFDSVYAVEAKLYQQLVTAQSDSARRVVEQVRVRAIERDQYRVQALTTQYGFPTYAMVSQTTSRHFGELILRYNRLPQLQQQVQQLMDKEAGKHNVDDIMLATLTDVVELRAGRPQVYGTQLAYQGAKTGVAVREPLLEPAKVNARRVSLGLEPLEDYLKKQKTKHQPKSK